MIKTEGGLSRVCHAPSIVRALAHVTEPVKLGPCVGALTVGVFLVDPRLESVGLPRGWTLSGSLGIEQGTRRTDRLLVVPNTRPLSLSVTL